MSKHRILVVDDESAIVNLVSQLLRRDGHEVFTASDGDAGLAAIYRALVKGDEIPAKLYELADCDHGAWRCHTGWECTAVCPSDVDPAGLLVSLRRKLVGYKIRRLFGMKA